MPSNAASKPTAPAIDHLDALGDALSQNPSHSTAAGAKSVAKTIANKPIAKTSVSAEGDGMPALPQREPPGMLRYMPAFIQDLWARGATFTLDSKDGTFLLEGFYKNGAMRLIERNGKFVAIDRRDNETPVTAFDDLAKLNYRWWRLSNQRSGHYVVPNRPWLDAFIEHGWAERKVIYVPVAQGDEGKGDEGSGDNSGGD